MWWLLAWAIIVTCYVNNVLDFVVFIIVILCAKYMSSGNDNSEDEKKIKALTQEKEILEHKYSAVLRELIRLTQTRVAPPQPDTIPISNESVVILRNTLLMHHNQRQTDPDYKESTLSKTTNDIVASLNNSVKKVHHS
jgi:hypothetical protein